MDIRKFISLSALLLMLLSSLSSAAIRVKYLHHDNLGSPVAATDEGGNVIWRETYAPYGEKVVKSGAAADERVGYTGKLHDNDTGLTYLNARYYDPVVGRFMAVDPVDVMQGGVSHFNRYTYTYNNPYKYIDPSGLFGIDFNTGEKIDGSFSRKEYNEYKREFDNPTQVMNEYAFRYGWKYFPGEFEFVWEYHRYELISASSHPNSRVASASIAGLAGVVAIETALGAYSKVGGHHIHAKSGFVGHVSYNPAKGFSISQEAMKKLGLEHTVMNTYQRAAFGELLKSGRPNTLREHTRIAVEALRHAGASRELARSLVARSLLNLRAQGVRAPSRIPWQR
ncbi:RHS repeat-associated core domain-containing protein [Hahella aquimaris]|uniref:RHS repeat domain-containing protein n=1 Tax=Hahella sp. HNIBRBA332 TaxID=3015983 RepID=UPI00273BFD66|nr:RHS repeat-associated core domain-containing protein [Hahella sp. HNIBRBA332]WLQ13303.1 RHS repeat-associated core domain-containing protein [Hahella sp. HNIBRBA332]